MRHLGVGGDIVFQNNPVGEHREKCDIQECRVVSADRFFHDLPPSWWGIK
jgi:hypothetical protein